MRIAMAGRYFNRQGGVSRCMAELSDRAARTDEVTVFTHELLDRGDSGARFQRVRMLRRPEWLQTQTFALALAHRLPRDEFDLVHVHNPQGLRADVYTAHSCHAAYLSQRRAEGGAGALLSRVYPPHVSELAFERWCYSDPASLVIALTPVVGAELERYVGVDPARIRVVPNGVDTREFSPPPSRERARADVAETTGALAPDAVALLFAGYEFERKGLAQVIEAMAALRDPRLHLWVAGSADQAPYRRLAERGGVSARVHFLGHQPSMAPLFRAADAFVFPTSYEPFGLVLVEALACGTPVITSRIAGMAGWMEDGVNGVLLDDPADSGELAAALGRFVAERGRWPQLQAEARTLAEQFDWDDIWRRTRAVYEEVAAAKTAAGTIRYSAKNSTQTLM